MNKILLLEDDVSLVDGLVYSLKKNHRAIGLSTRQLKKMIAAENCVYTAAGSIIGTAVGLICNKKLFEMSVTFSWGDAWAVPWMELAVILLAVMSAVIFAVREPVRKIHNMSIVDTISAQ